MRDWCSYTITAVARTAESDKFLESICFDLREDMDIDIAVETVESVDGVMTISGHIWHDEVNDFLLSEMGRHNAGLVVLRVCGIDDDVYFEDAPTCSFVGHGRAVYAPVEVTVNWPEFNKDLHSELKGDIT